ncbi:MULTISPECIES: phosphoglycerate kinase [Dehalococcoides]|uniref:Phosphoglycerate kinase n=1 Tax=Dehalococcoides mccartyi (strain CBDB1) TaxID=255470 RepID=A0A916KM93_DEHMC|nr:MULTISPECIES: phosphoglycerate kinase [Dehalococcoides]AGG06333.1 phosphoglycerate kinase [Dehalococcoides mccartyi DCMB5]AQU06597.1 phosphoglycerate kinase [Dehalococcoides mccartyi]AQU08034.1 phosphoglycerate kinase [Dehalococcoides mccartyi]AQX73954.1 phosphoglycerate kinase [Dehalococcoides mccartyi]OBW63365.1 MAG: phosphoglycerate kinase [Dehalococcoides mccartyi]
MENLTIRDLNFSGKKALVRVDFNVPINEETGTINDDSRIRAAIPTIDYLLDHQAKVILCSHLGRPDGMIVESMRLAPVAKRLSEILRQEVFTASDCIGDEVAAKVDALEDSQVLLLENLRFHPEEEANDPIFAKKLADLADIYVDDAFGTAHRKHASIVGVAKYLPAVAGLLLEKELNALGKVLEHPPRPFMILLGGAKVSDKVGMLENVMDKVDTILIGGGMAATFLKAQGLEIGDSLIDDSLDTAKMLMDKAKSKNVKIILPDDVLVTFDKIGPEARAENVSVENIPHTAKIVDIGLLTITHFTKHLEKCKTVFWNGPMGIYEIPQFSEGTRAMVNTMTRLHATTIIGGGSTAEIVTELNIASKMSFVSTGGGASLKFLSGEKLPGVEVLAKKNE